MNRSGRAGGRRLRDGARDVQAVPFGAIRPSSRITVRVGTTPAAAPGRPGPGGRPLVVPHRGEAPRTWGQRARVLALWPPGSAPRGAPGLPPLLVRRRRVGRLEVAPAAVPRRPEGRSPPGAGDRRRRRRGGADPPDLGSRRREGGRHDPGQQAGARGRSRPAFAARPGGGPAAAHPEARRPAHAGHAPPCRRLRNTPASAGRTPAGTAFRPPRDLQWSRRRRCAAACTSRPGTGRLLGAPTPGAGRRRNRARRHTPRWGWRTRPGPSGAGRSV